MRLPIVPVLLVTLAGAGLAANPPGVFRGRVLQIGDSSLQIRTLAGDSVHCRVDGRTYLEREGQRIFAGALRESDLVEIIAERDEASCYARTVRMLPGMRSSGLPVRSYSSIEALFPRGNLTFAGVVRRVSPEVLVLRTREDTEKIVHLREDTRYMSGGLPSEFSSLAVNTRVFIRGGKNLEDQLEAFQIIWGEIPGPHRSGR